MGFLTIVDGMPEIPHVCAVCAGNPYDEATGAQRQAIFAEGVDIDFGGALYICLDCAELIANLINRVPQEGYDALLTKHQALLEAHAELEKEHEELQEIVNQIRAGASASKRLRERVTT
jgi:hypothetical protein